jgi:hypothetical protein
MNRLRFAPVLLLAGLTALPAAAAVTIPSGDDKWVTPNNGQTHFGFKNGDVESLCGAPASTTWNHNVSLRGVPVTGTDYDTIVRRLSPATFDTSGNASTTVVVTRLELVSSAPQATPCGSLNWRVSLSGAQAATPMKFALTSTSPVGGVFAADIAVNVVFRATNAATGATVGSLFYNIVLPDPATGTPWSFGKTGVYRAGITPTDDCIAVLRQKLLTYPTTSSHYYWISDMIAQGLCRQTA